ncbi:MAG: translation initiation factor IF-2 [Oscillatoriales cyanobacterium SM2_2_1]|nr:translation initiation factor IF-2 [Oscillatoriales cyanobacterium SM2_2_1]
MGFADYSIAEIAQDYHLTISMVMEICQRLGISYADADTMLALEDAKAVIMAAESTTQPNDPPLATDVP